MQWLEKVLIDIRQIKCRRTYIHYSLFIHPEVRFEFEIASQKYIRKFHQNVFIFDRKTGVKNLMGRNIINNDSQRWFSNFILRIQTKTIWTTNEIKHMKLCTQKHVAWTLMSPNLPKTMSCEMLSNTLLVKGCDICWQSILETWNHDDNRRC